MAKRKRLTPVEIDALKPGTEPAPETKTIPVFPNGLQQVTTRRRAPIAQVAGDAAAQAALDEVADELRNARVEGRIVQDIALDLIEANHLVRDRMASDSDDMDELQRSLRNRGQQTPIEVIELGQGRYGLISGWRRLAAFRELSNAGIDTDFSTIKCLIRQIDTASDAYIAMVEENEIRTNLSYYERARLVSEAARIGIYANTAQALPALFASASPAKRSKIGSFVTVHQGLGDALKHPTAIPERLGLALAGALDADPGFGVRLRDRLRKADIHDVASERATLERALKKPGARSDTRSPKGEQVAPDLFLSRVKGKATLSGAGLTDTLLADLKVWLAAR